MTRTARAVLLGVVGIVLAVAMTFGVAVLISSGTVRSQLGVDVFVVGNAEALAERIAADDEPLLFPGLIGAERDLWVTHTGDDGRWVAFEARAPGSPRECNVTWDTTTGTFRDPCSGRSHGPEGAGLPAVEVEVDPDGLLVVDLRE